MKEYWDIYDRNRNKTGRVVERGQPMFEGEFHLAVHVWIRNRRGEWLISKRSPDKEFFPGIWEACGGAALAGEDSLAAALREAKEELGLTLNPGTGRQFCNTIRYHRHPPAGSCMADVWLFDHDCSLEDVVLCPGETCDARWETAETIQTLMASGEFFNDTYFSDLVAFTG